MVNAVVSSPPINFAYSALPSSVWQSALTQQLYNSYVAPSTVSAVLVPIDPNAASTKQTDNVVINNNYFVGTNAAAATPSSSSVTVVNVQPSVVLSKQNQQITNNIVNSIMGTLLGKSAVAAPVNPAPGSFQFRNISVSITSDIRPTNETVSKNVSTPIQTNLVNVAPPTKSTTIPISQASTDTIISPGSPDVGSTNPNATTNASIKIISILPSSN